jgi:hypothetical protein
MPTNHSRLFETTADQKLIDGLKQHLASETSIPVGKQPVVVATLVTVLENRIALAKAAAQAATARTEAVQAYRDARAKSAVEVRAVQRAIQARFYDSPATLADFGLTPPKKTGKKTVAVKSAAIEKSAATRAARHTMGSVQKKSVKGVVAPTTTAPAPSGEPAAAPSPSADKATSPAATPVTPKPVT